MKRFFLRLIMLVVISFGISIVYAGEKTLGIGGLMQHNTMQIDGIFIIPHSEIRILY